MILLVNGVVMVVVVEGVDFIGIAFGGRPHLISQLQLFTLLESWVGLLGVALKGPVAHDFIDH
jgi:hypothetical protein